VVDIVPGKRFGTLSNRDDWDRSCRSRRRIFVTKLCDLRSSLKDRRGNKPRCSGRSTDRDVLAERYALFRRAS